MPKSRHVLVVGGAGYVGNVLVRRLLGAGYRVRVLDRLLFEHGAALAGLLDDEPAFSFLRGDLRDPNDRRARRSRGSPTSSLLAALVGDPICKNYPELRAERERRRVEAAVRALLGRGHRPLRLHLDLQQLRAPRERRAGDRGVGPGAALAVRRDEGRVRAPRARPRGGLGPLPDGAADRHGVRTLASGCGSTSRSRSSPARWRSARSSSSTTPTPGARTATSPTSRGRS